MADRSVKLLLTADVKGLMNGLKTGAQATKDFGRDLDSWAKKNEQQLDTVGKGAMVAGGVVAAGIGLAIKSFADFDKSMSSVRAATHETEGNMALLRKAAIDAGADTAFSASEAAGAIEELAKAGVSTADIMGGGLDGSLALAAAGALDVGTAAELSATALTQFKLSGEQIPHVADLLAAGAGKAQGSVQDMGAALKQSGLVASQVGLTIEETTGGLAAFASAGLVGSDAGTSFKSMLQRLTPQSDKAAKLMDELGLNAYDAQGNFVGLSEYAGILQQGLADMTVEQRNAAMSTLFGSDAVRAAAVMYEQGAEGVQKWEDAVNDAGYAAETAAMKQDNLAGDIEKLGGSLDSVFLKSGSGANDVLRGLVQGLEGFVDMVGDIPEPVLNVGLIFSGIAGGAAIMGGAVVTAVPKIRDTVEAFRDLNASGSKIPGIVGKSAKAVGVAAVAYAGFATAAQLAAAAIDEKRTKTSVEQFTNALTGITDNAPAAAEALDRVFNGVSPTGSDIFTAVDDLESAMKRIGDPTVNDNISDFLGTAFGQNATTGINAAKDALSNLDGALTQFATSGSFDDAAAGFSKAWEAGQKAGIPTRELIDLFPKYRDAVTEAATANGITQMSAEDLVYAMLGMGPAALGAASGAESAAGGIGEVGGAAEEAATSLQKMLDGLVATGQIALSERDAHRQFQEAVDGAAAALEENGKTLDRNTEKGRANESALDELASRTLGIVTAQDEAGKSAGKMAETLQKGRDEFIGMATDMGMGRKEAEKLATQLGLTPEVVVTDFQSNADELSQKLEILHERIQSTPNKSITISDNSPETVAGLEALGYKVEHLPNGKIKVTETGAKDVGDKLDGVSNKKRTATINAAAETGMAEAELNNAARDRTSRVTQYVFKADGGSADGVPKGGFINSFPERATGGRLPRTGLGTDKILGVNSKGAPVAWVDDEEWVINKRSSDKHDRLLGMINRDDPALQRLGGLATGGRAAWSVRDEARLKREYELLKSAVPKKDKGNSDAVQRAQKRADNARDAYRAAKERTARLNEGAFDMLRDVKRGSVRDSVMSGSGLSVVDQMFDESRNKDLSKWNRRNLRKVGYQSESALLKLEKQSDSLTRKLEKATAKYEELLSVKDKVSSGLRGEFSLSNFDNFYSGDSAMSAGALVKNAESRVQKIKKFGKLLERLRKKGYSSAIIQEVAELGSVNGSNAAEVLLGATGSERKRLNAAYRGLDKYSDTAGVNVTKSMYKGGINAAEGLIEGLEDKQEALEKTMVKIAKRMEKALRKAWGINSPSRLMRGLMHHVGDGGVIGLKDKEPAMAQAMADLVPKPEVYGGWSIGAPSVPPSREVSAHAATVDMAAVGASVAEAMSGWQPVVKIDGREFKGLMKQANGSRK